MHIIALDQPDIITLSEVLPKNGSTPVAHSEIQVEGYDCVSNLLVDFVHRGIINYVRKTLNASPSQLVLDFSESVRCEIPLEKKIDCFWDVLTGHQIVLRTITKD